MLLLEVFLRKKAAEAKLDLIRSLYSSVLDCPLPRQESLYNSFIDQELKLVELIKNCNVVIGSAEATLEVKVDNHILKLKDLREWVLATERNVEAIDRLIGSGIKAINFLDILTTREGYITNYIKYKALYDEVVALTDTDTIGKKQEEE